MQTYYTQLVSSPNWLDEMKEISDQILSIFEQLTEEQSNFAYEPNKWTLKTLLEHLIDCERVFVYRALRFSKNDKTPLAGFDENLYANNETTSNQILEDLIEEFKFTRKSSIAFFAKLSPEQLQIFGTANNSEINIEQIGKHIVGHNIHHLNIIIQRYLPHLL